MANQDQNKKPDQAKIEVGELLNNRYEIIRLLGKGAFAETYLALDREFSRHVAIKVFHPERVDTWKSYELFEREVQALQTLKHSGIPQIYDFFEAEDQHHTSLIIMEFIEGDSLQKRLASGPSFDHLELTELFLKLLDILEYLHTRIPPVLHRDIKPSNIIIKPDKTPVLIDFGSVRTIFKAPDERGSTIIGTYGYMPYEQYMGQASQTSDLYSLAATMLEIMTRRPPSDFICEDGVIIIPEDFEGPPLIKHTLITMLAPTGKDRIQTAQEVKHSLLATVISNAPEVLQLSRTATAMAPTENTENLDHIQLKLDLYFTDYAPDWKQLISTNSQGELPDKLTRGNYFTIGALSLVSLCLAPLGVWLYQRYLAKKFRPFFERGKLTKGKVDKMFLQQQRESSRTKYRVLYSFTADGKICRSAIIVRPNIAHSCREGAPVYVLYLPEENYQSIIIGEV